MRNLLTLCGFEQNEIDMILPRAEAAFSRLGIEKEDFDRAANRLRNYYDMELNGIKRAIGLCIRDVIDTILAREDGKKIIYGIMASCLEVLGTAVRLYSDDVHVSQITNSFPFVLGCVFGKLEPILEAAESKWLKAGGVRHCGNVKACSGLMSLGMLPKPDLLVTSGQLCDTAPKTVDLLHEFYDIPVCYFDTCQDTSFQEYPDLTRPGRLLARSLRELSKTISRTVDIEITDDVVTEAITKRNELGGALRRLQSLLESSDPLALSPTHDQVWACLNTSSFNLPSLKEAVAVINEIYQQVERRILNGEGVLPKGAPRIISTLPANSSDPRQEHLLSELGIASVSFEAGLFPLHGNRYIDFELETPSDPYEMIAWNLQKPLFHVAGARASIIVEACKRLNVDGVLCRYHVGCRNVSADAMILRDEIDRQLHIPVLLLQWESFDPRIYNEAELRTQVQAFKEIMTKRLTVKGLNKDLMTQ
jgi:benzoyl-CoA reductase/2-hydroxyglutaryl-CoA dehydratase subunit BcrC/BadD/HgdB